MLLPRRCAVDAASDEDGLPLERGKSESPHFFLQQQRQQQGTQKETITLATAVQPYELRGCPRQSTTSLHSGDDLSFPLSL